jgi:sugar/nucleoside kinase (ribokinase family)
LVAHGAPAPIDALDTTGAGDAFFAGFIAARLRGAAPPDCLACAHQAGARAVMRMGARP